jgi:hypothetical protein
LKSFEEALFKMFSGSSLSKFLCCCFFFVFFVFFCFFFFFVFFRALFGVDALFAGLESNPAAESFFRDFLSFELPLGNYMERVRTVVSESKRRLVVNMDDLRAFDAQVARAFLAEPNQYLPHWEKVLHDLVKVLLLLCLSFAF